jgi:hypothetical protein
VAACAIAVVAGACAGTGAPTSRARAAPAREGAHAPFVGEDLRDYYPNLSRYTSYYLEGDDYTPGQPRLSVLWFEPRDQQTFRVYNSPPASAQARCGYDDLSWWGDGYLRYVRTVTACDAPRTEIVYDAPIIFLPDRWDGRPWRLDGRSSARYSIDGRPRCQGTNAWTAEIVGVEQVAPGDVELHWRTTQTTTWATGDVRGGCYAGFVTRWREDYWLTGQLTDPAGDHRGKGLRRTAGGNLDVHNATWDIRIARWMPLPRP